jgi:hypothetical protein
MVELYLHSPTRLHGMTTLSLPYDRIQIGEMGRAFSMHGENKSSEGKEDEMV